MLLTFECLDQYGQQLTNKLLLNYQIRLKELMLRTN